MLRVSRSLLSSYILPPFQTSCMDSGYVSGPVSSMITPASLIYGDTESFEDVFCWSKLSITGGLGASEDKSYLPLLHLPNNNPQATPTQCVCVSRLRAVYYSTWALSWATEPPLGTD